MVIKFFMSFLRVGYGHKIARFDYPNK